MSRRADARPALLAAAALAAACASAKPAPDAIVFPHNVHAEQGIGCADCHRGLERDAEQAVDPFLKMSQCGDCHDVASAKECGRCHINTAAPATYRRPPPTHLLFSHQRHQERDGNCARCHAKASGAPALPPGGRRLLPGHPECNTCHQADTDAGRCQLCHDRLDLYGREPQTLYSHAPGFFERHGLKAAGGQDVCAQCHDQSFCADCHARTMTVNPALRFPDRPDRSFMHVGDWISRHVVEARAGDGGCLKCHGTSFCAACHERTGAGGATGRGSPHPAAWMDPGSAEGHGRAARRRINECAACHDQGPASNCVGCHRSGGVDPHPPGWKPPVPRGQRAAHAMCSICHVD